MLAAEAGADILLYTDSASGELGALEQALHRGMLSRSEADASYQRIVALKTTAGRLRSLGAIAPRARNTTLRAREARRPPRGLESRLTPAPWRGLVCVCRSTRRPRHA